MNDSREISEVKCGICNRSHKSTIEVSVAMLMREDPLKVVFPAPV